MVAARTGLWRRRPVLVYLGLGLPLAAILLAVVPFAPDTTARAKLLMAVFFWLFASACVAAIFWTAELVADVVRWVRRRKMPAGPQHHAGPLPELSPARRTRLAHAVDILAAEGVLGPATLDPVILHAGVAERDEPIKPVVIFDALVEAGYYHPGFVPAPYMANLVRHESQVEQPEAYIAEQVADLARLSDGALEVCDVAVTQIRRGGGRGVETRIIMTVGGVDVTLDYAGHEKALSTALHHELAVRLRAIGTGRRLAWMWDDAGPWISCLADGAVERLNTAFKLGARSAYRWSWIDAEPGYAAGAD